MALMLLTVAIFFLLCDFFSAGAGCSFVLSTCGAPPNKTSGGAECGRVFFFFGGGGHDVWCVSAAKLLSPPAECEQRPVAGFH